MELHQVRYFIALCATLNFTRAAEACNVTQPALTRAIQRLEEELGGPLFQRERNLTQLTELGRLMRPFLEQTLAAAEMAKEHASRFHKSEVGSLRLGLLPTVSPRLVAGPLAEVVRRLPTVEIRMRTADQGQLVEDLMAGELDAALLVDGEELPERLDRWSLFREGYRAVFCAGHRLAALDAVSLGALDGEIILERHGCAAVRRIRDLCEAAGAAPRLRHLGETEEHIQQLAALALGVALVPEHVPVLPALATRPVAEAALQRTIVLAAVNGRRHSPTLDAFIRLSRARDFMADLAA